MKSLTKRTLFGLCGSSLLAGLLSAQSAAAQPALFYDDTKRGWFWYEESPVEAEQEPEPETPARPVPSLQAHTTEELWDMHPDDFHELLMELQKEAVRRPTEQNVLEYITIQDIARRKAAAYANVAAYVTQKYAEFDLTQAYPSAMPGVRARVQQQQQEVGRTIQSGAGDHALLYFTDPGCSYCVEQTRIMGHFTDRYRWEVKEIDIRARPDLAAQFGAQRTPTLLLIKRHHSDHLTVATGVISLDELERKLYRSIRLLRGEIGPEEFSLYEFQRGGPFDPGSILINNANTQPGGRAR